MMIFPKEMKKMPKTFTPITIIILMMYAEIIVIYSMFSVKKKYVKITMDTLIIKKIMNTAKK